MNWGNKILVLYLSFVALIVAMVTMSMKQKVELVAPDYYAQELKFQDKIDGKDNFKRLNTPIEYSVSDDTIEIHFPTFLVEKNMVGNILLYRPSDSSLDVKNVININEKGIQRISSENFKRGLYKIQIEWAMEGEKYFDEKNLFIN